MTKDRNIQGKLYGDEAPTVKDFVAVLIVVAVLIILAWMAYYKFHFGAR